LHEFALLLALVLLLLERIQLLGVGRIFEHKGTATFWLQTNARNFIVGALRRIPTCVTKRLDGKLASLRP
jgi:hypothetical protein